MTVDELVSVAKRELMECFLGILERAMDTSSMCSSDFMDARSDLTAIAESGSGEMNGFRGSVRTYLGLCEAVEEWGPENTA